MKSFNIVFIGTLIIIGLIAQNVFAKNVDKAAVAVSGYDVVSYHMKSGPTPGSGWHVSEYDGVTFLFANKKNKRTFDRDPDKYLPAYGGFCAYGVAVGKKFYSDPLAWHIKNDRLYLNLDDKIQSKWLKDVPGFIEKADKNWKEIADKSPEEL